MPPENTACARARRRSATLFAASLSFLALVVFAADAPAAGDETVGDTFAVSVTAAGAYADAPTSPTVSISGDGRYVAFVSAAENLSTEAPAGTAEVYVKDLETGAVKLVSRASGETGAPAEPMPIGGNAAGQIEAALISGNGRYVTFASPADNLVPGLPLASEVTEESFLDHIYRRDLQTGETVLVDRVNGSTGDVVGIRARVTSISDNGRYVVFGSEVEDLEDPAGTHEAGAETVYVRDLQEGTTTAVGRASNEAGQPGELAAEGSFEGDITPDGRHVVFSSSSANLDPDTNGLFQVYRRDLQTGETTLVSRTNPTQAAPSGEVSDGEAFEPSFVGANGCRVGFTAVEATNLFGGPGRPEVATYVRDLCATPPTTTLISLDEDGQPFAEGVLAGSSDDGREVLLKAASLGAASHLFLRDPDSSQTTLVDRAGGAAGAPAELGVEQGALAGNGCRAVFTSGATNLTPEAPPQSGSSPLQVYARQLAPCKPPAEKPSPGPAAGPLHQPPPLSVGVARLTRKQLWLDFDGAATARVRIQCQVARGKWRLAKAFLVSSLGPERVEVSMPRLPKGRCRGFVRLQVPGAPPEGPAPIR